MTRPQRPRTVDVETDGDGTAGPGPDAAGPGGSAPDGGRARGDHPDAGATEPPGPWPVWTVSPEGDAPRDGLGARVVARARAVWARTPLLTRLVGISTVLLALGLTIASTATTTLLNTYLMGQLDSRLQGQVENASAQFATIFQREGNLDSLQVTPSWGERDYAMVVSVLGKNLTLAPEGKTLAESGSPELPSVDLTSLRDTQTFSVHSSARGSTWRVSVAPVQLGNTNVGYVAYAEPLTDIEDIVKQAALLLLTSAVAILVIGAIVGTWAVQRSLRGLREIETTAGRIAAGDLSERVPPAPETTEVGRLGAALNSMLSQIETAFDARTRSEERMRRFVADASHELRTPLAAIRGYGELYRMGALTEKDQVDDTMRRIEQSATRMGGLVEDLLALARLDADRADKHAPVDLAVLATDAAHDLRAIDPTREVRVGPLTDPPTGTGPATGARSATGSAPASPRRQAAPAGAHEPGGTLPPTVVLGDEARLRQVVANLVGNVARHTPAGTPAELAVGRVGDRVLLEVRDHGPGIAPEHAARVFERFYRVDPSRTREGTGSGGGAGLGMAIVAAIVSAHHGEVAIAQTPGGGTTVRVALPVGEETGGAAAEEHPAG